MRTVHEEKSKTSETMGYLLGFTIALLAAVLVFVISKNFVIAVATSIPIGVTLGIAFKERFQKGKNLNLKPRVLIGALFLGLSLLCVLLIAMKTI